MLLSRFEPLGLVYATYNMIICSPLWVHREPQYMAFGGSDDGNMIGLHPLLIVGGEGLSKPVIGIPATSTHHG